MHSRVHFDTQANLAAMSTA